jgi:hypothetical protein
MQLLQARSAVVAPILASRAQVACAAPIIALSSQKSSGQCTISLQIIGSISTNCSPSPARSPSAPYKWLSGISTLCIQALLSRLGPVFPRSSRGLAFLQKALVLPLSAVCLVPFALSVVTFCNCAPPGADIGRELLRPVFSWR